MHPDPHCLALAERRKAFPRALRRSGPLDVAAVREYVAAQHETEGPASSGAGPTVNENKTRSHALGNVMSQSDGASPRRLETK